MLYLGADINGEGRHGFEIDRRIAAGKVAWRAMRGVWRFEYFCIKRMIYIGLVVNSLLSGLEAVLLTSSHFAKMEKFHCKRRLRRFLLGKAHTVDAETGARSTLTNDQVRRATESHSLMSMWQARRCRWMQKFAAEPKNNAAMLAVFHGQFDHEFGAQLGPGGRVIQGPMWC